MGIAPSGAVYLTGIADGEFRFGRSLTTGVGAHDWFVTRLEPEAPVLSIAAQETCAVLSWPAHQSGFALEQRVSMNSNWQILTNLTARSGAFFVVTNKTQQPTEYFRLRLVE